MITKVSTFYFNSVSQSGSGVTWTNPVNAFDNNPDTYAESVTSISNSYLTTYNLSGSFLNTTLAYYSGDGWFGFKRILKIEIGFYTDVTSAFDCYGNIYCQISLNGGANYSTILIRTPESFALSAPTLTWVDITSISGAPTKWEESNIASLKTNVICDFSTTSTDTKYVPSQVNRVYGIFARVTWTINPDILFSGNF